MKKKNVWQSKRQMFAMSQMKVTSGHVQQAETWDSLTSEATPLWSMRNFQSLCLTQADRDLQMSNNGSLCLLLA